MLETSFETSSISWIGFNLDRFLGEQGRDCVPVGIWLPSGGGRCRGRVPEDTPVSIEARGSVTGSKGGAEE